MGKFATTVHVHEWLYNKMYEIAKNSDLTQAEAMDVLYMDLTNAVMKERQEKEALEAKLKAVEQEKAEIEKKYQELNAKVNEGIQKIEAYEKTDQKKGSRHKK
ncbi:MAG: hypothetical protein C0175_06255 [Caldisericum exile]|uniref:Uncharacterized protein n=1 Tax=Caldisericum exile TaxID=693075 RepID=A0A2J6X407_9BACT|nr:MAG: hypothetical protein C0175_06255 [Caldisericum exile]